MTCHKRWMTKSLKSWERGVFRSGDAIQVIIGLHVSQLREQLDSLINSHQSAENVAITEAV